MTHGSCETPRLDQFASPGHARLALLGLSDIERTALEHNGSVSTEWRGRKLRYKLRFRAGGKQRVRFLGYDPAVAASVTSALVELQRSTRTIQQLRELCRAGRASMRRESSRSLRSWAPLA